MEVTLVGLFRGLLAVCGPQDQSGQSALAVLCCFSDPGLHGADLGLERAWSVLSFVSFAPLAFGGRLARHNVSDHAWMT